VEEKAAHHLQQIQAVRAVEVVLVVQQVLLVRLERATLVVMRFLPAQYLTLGVAAVRVLQVAMQIHLTLAMAALVSPTRLLERLHFMGAEVVAVLLTPLKGTVEMVVEAQEV
jgi:hypothetical protein